MKATPWMATQDSFPSMTLDFIPVPGDPQSQNYTFCTARSENKLSSLYKGLHLKTDFDLDHNYVAMDGTRCLGYISWSKKLVILMVKR